MKKIPEQEYTDELKDTRTSSRLAGDDEEDINTNAAARHYPGKEMVRKDRYDGDHLDAVDVQSIDLDRTSRSNEPDTHQATSRSLQPVIDLFRRLIDPCFGCLFPVCLAQASMQGESRCPHLYVPVPGHTDQPRAHAAVSDAPFDHAPAFYIFGFGALFGTNVAGTEQRRASLPCVTDHVVQAEVVGNKAAHGSDDFVAVVAAIVGVRETGKRAGRTVGDVGYLQSWASLSPK